MTVVKETESDTHRLRLSPLVEEGPAGFLARKKKQALAARLKRKFSAVSIHTNDRISVKQARTPLSPQTAI